MFLYRDEDHLASFMELLGRIPRKAIAGKYARDYFNRHGELRHIKRLHFWGLESILVEKYNLPQQEVGTPLYSHASNGYPSVRLLPLLARGF